MNPDEIQRLKEEAQSRYRAEIEGIKAEGENVDVVFEDRAVEAEAKSVGYKLVGFVGKYAVRVFRSISRRGVIYVLIGALIFGAITDYYCATEVDAPRAYQEYVGDFSSWYHRSLSPTEGQQGTYLIIPPQTAGALPPHVPEEGYSSLLIRPGSVVAPVSGFSASISGNYVRPL